MLDRVTRALEIINVDLILPKMLQCVYEVAFALHIDVVGVSSPNSWVELFKGNRLLMRSCSKGVEAEDCNDRNNCCHNKYECS